MLVQHEAPLGGDFILAQFDAFIDEFIDLAATRADQVIVVLAFIQFEDGMARFEVPAKQNARLGKLHQHAVDGGEAHVDFFSQQEFVDIVRTQVLDAPFLKQLQNPQAGDGHFQARFTQFPQYIHVSHSFL